MANEQLTSKDLFNLVRKISSLITESTNRRLDLYENDKITLGQSEYIHSLEGRLSNVANEAANSAIKQVITDLSDAAKVLQKTTDDLNAVIKKLEDFNNFIASLANLINIFSKISQAIAGGTTAIITTLVDEVQKQTNSTSSRSSDGSSRSIDNASPTAGNINEI